MEIFRTKRRVLNANRVLEVTKAGDCLIIDKEKSLNSLKNTEADKIALKERGFGFEERGDIYHCSSEFRLFKRKRFPKILNYIIAVPTLRCDLACSYCQVSRANLNASGYDWTEDTLQSFISFVEKNASDNVKIEFQGGEPSLRIDLIQRAVEAVSESKQNASFVICTNLSSISEELKSLLKRNDFTVSSSLDGSPNVHEINRTNSADKTSNFFSNLNFVLEHFGSQKVSLLPTITDFSNTKSLINYYSEMGINEIFLRPVNYQGFARKTHADAAKDTQNWISHYISALDYIEEHNSKDQKIIETGLAIHLKRIFSSNSFDYVDFRNPNLSGVDYLVVNYDGQLFPSDEARMLYRSGVIDLSIGNIKEGLDTKKIQVLNSRASNFGDECCDKCAYQVFCGTDNFDKLSRYGTLNVKTSDTNFCQTHIAIFDYIFRKIASRSSSTIKNFSLHLCGEYSETSLFSDIYYD